MEIYTSQDKQVTKYIHNDGSETAIKTVPSCGNILNKLTNKIEPIEVDRNKYSIFISSSVGCPIGCKFCYLTVKKFPYHKLSPADIFSNVKEAIISQVKRNPELRKKYVKLSWMGMGDAFLLDPKEVRMLSTHIARWIIYNGRYACGLDGIDIATTYPRKNYGWPYQMASLIDSCSHFPINPKSKNRSIVRIFYSLHKNRDRLSIIPTSLPSPIAAQYLEDAKRNFGIDIILQHMFLKEVNEKGLFDVRNIMDYLPDSEIRILRFNKCKNSPYQESPKFDRLVKLFSDSFPKVKYQVSAGSEIKAACGQFICKVMK